MKRSTKNSERKILLLGANGRTGREIIQQARGNGWEVTAVVRSPDLLPDELARDVRLCVADPCREASLAPLVPGHDAVLSVLGPRRPFAKAASVYPRSAAAIVAAMRGSGVRRLLVTSSALLFPQRRLLDRLLKKVVSALVDAASAMEAEIRRADVDWTIARTSFLTNDRATTARVLGDEDFESSAPRGAVSRAAVARFLVDEVSRGRHVEQTVGLYG